MENIQRTWVTDVILPLAIGGRYTYVLPKEYEGAELIGRRVLVPFGKRQQYGALVAGCRYLYSPDEARKLKPVLEVLDEEAIFQDWQISFMEWVAKYYMCHEGEVLRAAMPTGLKLDSSLVLVPADGVNLDDPDLSDKAYLLLEALMVEQKLSKEAAADILGLKDAGKYIKELEVAGSIKLLPEVNERYTQRTITCLEIAPSYREETLLNEAFESLGRAPRQEAILLVLAEAMLANKLPSKQMVLEQAGASAGSLKPLLDKGYVQKVAVPISRLLEIQHSSYKLPEKLTDDQQSVLDKFSTITEAKNPKPALLHGETGSGKTLVYTRLAQQVVAEGKQVLLVLPEIALTKQIVERFRAAFGDLLGVYHSRFSEAERVEIWLKALQGDYRVVVGVRSSIWLPFPNLGLIIVDEEHDGSMKQQDAAPRYNARDAALYIAHQLNIPILLGSATPSLEAYSLAEAGKYQLLRLPEPINKGPLPELSLVDMRHDVQHHLSDGRFSRQALDALAANLSKGEQSAVFVHRRGYAPYLVCTTCGSIPTCQNCDISLTYHKHTNQLKCHYCGYTDSQSSTCGYCHHPTLRQLDYGTERVAEQLQELLPKARIARMDADTTRGKHAFQQLLDRFEQRDIDILVGTQMLTKGLDFPELTLAVVQNADALLGYPDFRAEERAWQLMRQFAGRTGRHKKQGKVLVQTFKPDHPVLGIIQDNYKVFYSREMLNRRQFAYPPFSRLLSIELQHKNRSYLEHETLAVGDLLRKALKGRLSGPATPSIERLRGYFRRQFLIRLPRGAETEELKLEINQLIALYYEQAANKTLRVVLNVDVM